MPVNIIIDSKFDDKGIKDAQRQLKTFAGDAAKRVAQVGAAVAAAGAVAAGKLAVDAVRAASDFEESVNAVNVAFGEAASGVLEIGENAARSMGLSQNEFNQAATRFSAFAETVVGEGGNVAGFIGDVSQRAADFASVFNIDVSEALQVFQSGLAGEAEPLKRFGINLLQSEVAAFAMANGIAESASQMTEAQKVQARYGLLLESTAKTQADFTNTSDSLANSQRILRAELENLQIEIGSALIPVAKELVNTFGDALIPRLEDFGRWINSPEGIASVTDFGEGLVEVFEAALDFGGWIADNLELLKNLGITIATVTVGVQAYRAAVIVAAAAQAGLNAAMLLNPIGALVGLFAAVTTAVTLFTIGNQNATPSQEELTNEIERTKDELAFYRTEQEKSTNTSKLYESTITDLENKLRDLQEAQGQNVRFTKESVIATDAAKFAARDYGIEADKATGASDRSAEGFANIAKEAADAMLGVSQLSLAEQARAIQADEIARIQLYGGQAEDARSFTEILNTLTARTKFQTQAMVENDRAIEEIGRQVPTIDSASSSVGRLGSEYSSVTEEIRKATEAQNAFTNATPGSPGPGGLFEAIFPDGSKRLVNIEGEEFRGLSTGGQQLGRTASGAISSVGRGSRGQAIPTFINPETNRKIMGNIQGSRLEELLSQGFEQVKLARGGLVTQPTRALIGEAGPEAVIPMSKLDRMMRGGGKGGGNTYIINVQANSRISGAQAGEEVVNALKTYNTNNGDFNRALTGFGA